MFTVASAVLAKGKTLMGQGLAKRLAQGFAVGVGTRVLMLGMHLIVGRKLGVAGYGTFAYMTGLVTLFGIVGSLGWSEVIPRFIAQHHAEGEWKLLRGVVETGNRIVFRTTLLIGGLTAVAGVCFVKDPTVGCCLFVCGTGLPIVATRQFRFRQLQGVNKTKLGMFLGEGFVPGSLVLIGLTIGVGSPVMAILNYVLLSLLSVVIMTWLLFKHLPTQIWKASPRTKFKEWQSIATPAILGRSGLILSRRVDLIMIGPMLGMSAVGLYSSAFRLSFALQFIPIVIGNIVQPMFARAWFDGHVDEVKRVFTGSLLASASIAIPTAAVLLIFPEQVLWLFGGEFTAGTSLLIVFVLGQFIDAITGPVAPLLVMTGNEKFFGKSTAIISGLNILGNLIAIPAIGVMGAALVTAASIVSLNLWQFSVAWKAIRQAEQTGVTGATNNTTAVSSAQQTSNATVAKEPAYKA